MRPCLSCSQQLSLVFIETIKKPQYAIVPARASTQARYRHIYERYAAAMQACKCSSMRIKDILERVEADLNFEYSISSIYRAVLSVMKHKKEYDALPR
jgi:hypothetical protein